MTTAEDIAGQITITRFKDPTRPFQVNINGNWTLPQLAAIHPICVKANRKRIQLLMQQTQGE
jgi:hypothetical protein